MQDIRYVELFAGIGGFGLAFNQSLGERGLKSLFLTRQSGSGCCLDQLYAFLQFASTARYDVTVKLGGMSYERKTGDKVDFIAQQRINNDDGL